MLEEKNTDNKEYILQKRRKHERHAIDSLNLELTGTNSAILNAQTIEQTIIYLEFAALILEEVTKEEHDRDDENALHKTSTALQEKMTRVRTISYENLRAHTIKQGYEANIIALRSVHWQGSNDWEKEFRNNILKAILKKKINLYTVPPLPDETLDNELQNVQAAIQLDLIEGFSAQPSLNALYQAYNSAPSHVIKKALTHHVFGIMKTFIKTKITAISFIFISVLFWYAWPYLQKHYPKELRYLYELIALILLDRKLIAI